MQFAFCYFGTEDAEAAEPETEETTEDRAGGTAV